MSGVVQAGARRARLAEIPGGVELAADLWRLPAVKSPQLLCAAGLVLDGPRPLLVDAGMAPESAAALRDSGLVARLHLTHMHLDHRMHQQWFVADEVSCPEVERPAFQSWDTWLAFSGFPAAMHAGFHAWRQATFAVDVVPHVHGVGPGEDLNPGGLRAEFLALPGHTVGHSGLWFPELRAALVTDYDMERFGPWYGNPTSDLAQYVATLQDLLARAEIDTFITGHTQGVLERPDFERAAARYLQMIEDRSARLRQALVDYGPQTLDGLVGRGIFYPRGALKRMPLFECFERRMSELHLLELAARGEVARDGDRWVAH